MRPKTLKKSRLEFLLTETGKKYVRCGLFGLGSAVIAAFSLPNTIFVEKYKSILEAYRFGKPRQVPDSYNERINKACKAIALKDSEQENVKPFMFGGFDVIEIGSLRTRFGGWIGIPLNFEYDQPSDIDKTNIRFGQENIQWNTPHGELLEESLILTEDEQIFGISRSILELKSSKLITKIAFPTVTMLSVYFTALGVNKKFNLYAAHRVVRVGFYQCLALFGAGIYCCLTDSFQKNRDADIDDRLASLGPEWCKAGVNYYTKILNKNIVHRELSGKDIYTAKGNLHYFIREKSLPLTYRKKYFEKRLQEYQEAELKSNSRTESVTKSKD